MIREIFCRMPSDPNFVRNGSLEECTTAEETLLQRIRVCLGTKKGDVLGFPEFGIDLEEYIFDMGVDKEEIESAIKLHLGQYALRGFEDVYSVDVSCSFGKDITDANVPADYMLVDIYINEQKAMGVIVS